MNGFYNGYDSFVFETPEEKQAKIKKQRGLFSRVFLALAVYIISSRVFATGAYLLANVLLDAAEYQRFAASETVALSISCIAQYVVAFPIFLLMLIGTPKAANNKRSTLTATDFFLIFAIGESLMYVGNLAGNYINELVGAMLGRQPENSIATTINETHVLLIFVCMVILAPIVEELIFRKLMIDRLSVYGEKTAIIFSSVAFGLMHGNMYQFFYAALLGALFGYVYVKTKNVKYTVFMHAIINFMGSIVALPVQKALDSFYEITEAASNGIAINAVEFLVSACIIFIYSSIQYGLVIGGAIALFQFAKRKRFALSSVKEVDLPDDIIRNNGIKNVGAILFLVFTVGSMILNLILV